MCTLAVYFRAFPDYPLVIAANRDEFLARPTRPPGPFEGGDVFGGRDERAGGTWFAISRSSLAAALLNRRVDEPPDLTRRSRGLLCTAALCCPSARAARDWITGERPEAYNPFNLLVADAREAWVSTNHGGRLSVTNLPAGLHLLTNLDLNDPTCPRIAASYRLFAALLECGGPPPGSADFAARLKTILASHDTNLDPRSAAPGNSLCLHLPEYGTRSSTIALLDREGRWTYLHADEPPCRGEYRDYPVPWQGRV